MKYLLLILLIPLNLFSQIDLARIYIGQTETKPNRSVLIDNFNKHVGNSLGSPYCTAFVCYILDYSGLSGFKKTGLATAFKWHKKINASKVLLGQAKIKKGMVVIWQKGKTIFGHSGFVSQDWTGSSGWTIQANTSKNRNTRDGEGIYEKIATIEPFNYFRIIRFWL